MTSILKKDDKIFNMYKQYKELIHKDVEEKDNRVYGTDQLAAQLTVAHMLDHVVCLFKKDESPTVRKVNKTWEKKFDDSAEAEIMQNNFQVTSSSADDCRWGQCVCGASSSIVDESKPITYTTSTSAGSTNINWGRNV